MKRALIPLAVFIALVGFLAAGLSGKPRELPSALLDRPAPAFRLPVLSADAALASTAVAHADLRGQVWMLNVWASWCAACREEHPALMDFARRAGVPIYGLNYKDQPEAALRWLAQHGDPYRRSLRDTDGRVGIDFGVYGVPETFIIDRDGVVRFKHVGALTPDILNRQVVPLLKQLRG
ncbi:MAG: DsbE family thiol:disulfide interchange protein [Burkholderiaceae bacterium]